MSRGCTSGGIYAPCIYSQARWELPSATRVFVGVLVLRISSVNYLPCVLIGPLVGYNLEPRRDRCLSEKTPTFFLTFSGEFIILDENTYWNMYSVGPASLQLFTYLTQQREIGYKKNNTLCMSKGQCVYVIHASVFVFFVLFCFSFLLLLLVQAYQHLCWLCISPASQLLTFPSFCLKTKDITSNRYKPHHCPSCYPF